MRSLTSIENRIVFLTDTGSSPFHIENERGPQFTKEEIREAMDNMLEEGLLTAAPDHSWIVVTEWCPNEAKKFREEKSPPKENECKCLDVDYDDESECDFYANAIAIVSWAWLSPEKELEQSVKSLNSLIGKGYYDDGDDVLIPVRDYLLKRLGRKK